MVKLQNPRFTGWQLKKHKKQYRTFREANCHNPNQSRNIRYYNRGCKNADECIFIGATFLSVQIRASFIYSHDGDNLLQAIEDWNGFAVPIDAINLAARLLGLQENYPRFSISSELVLPHYSRIYNFGRENHEPPTALFTFRENWNGEIMEINLPPDRKAIPEDILRIPAARMAELTVPKPIPASGFLETQSLSDRYLIKRKVNREDK